jgi:hypothetical protein
MGQQDLALDEVERKFRANTLALHGRRDKSLAAQTAAAQPARYSFPPLVNRTRSEEERLEQERENANQGFMPSWNGDEDYSRESANEEFTLAQPEVAEAPERNTRARRPEKTLERRATNGSALSGRTARAKQAPLANTRRRNAPIALAVPAKRTAVTPVQGQTKRQRGEDPPGTELLPPSPVAMNCTAIAETTVPKLQLRVKGSEVEALALSTLNRSSVTNQHITLDAWFEKMRSKDPAQFKAWLWKGLQAGRRCLGYKTLTRADTDWVKPDRNYACRVCMKSKRPCIQLVEVEADGVAKRELHVLPSQDEEYPHGYWEAPPFVA